MAASKIDMQINRETEFQSEFNKRNIPEIVTAWKSCGNRLLADYT